MLGELSREDETDRGLDLARRDGRLLVVGSELGRLGRDALEDVVDERVEDEHGPARDEVSKSDEQGSDVGERTCWRYQCRGGPV